MKSSRYTLDDLATLTGIEPRTIRSYIQKGLIPGPEALGRKAYYLEHHLGRLKTVKFLKDFHGLQLKEIRHLLLRFGDDQLEDLKQVLAKEDVYPHAQEPLTTPDSALEYIRQVKGRASQVRPEGAAADSHLQSDGIRPGRRTSEGERLRPLLESLRQGLKHRRVARSSQGEPWMHIEVTPDVMLTVRGNFSVHELALFEQIADHVRQFILGGGEAHEK